MDRRHVLKNFSLLAGVVALPDSPAALSFYQSSVAPRDLSQNFDRPVKVITVGAGNRGNTYGAYSLQFPDQMQIVGVAEPIEQRNSRYAKTYSISDANRFVTWEHVFERPKFADAVIISTPDQLHYGPCMKALEVGYDVLLEKPISPSEGECLDILAMARKTGRIVAVCHVLRYAPYFVELKRMIDEGAVGELISVDHFEPIERVHMAHSFVRGNWHNSRTSTPIIMGKSCHDMDILRWLVGQPCESISAYGDLKWFRKENAPEGSTKRCTDDCRVESTCPYSARRIYLKERQHTYVFDLPNDPAKREEVILAQLKTSNYGRCVYRMDNDQPDHYVTSMRFKGGVTANFSMEAFTSYHGRRTRVMGSMGDIVGDMDTYTYTDFITGKTVVKKVETGQDGIYASHGHGGGDMRLIHDWLNAVGKQDPTLLTSTIDASVDSHIMCFRAEESRLEEKMVQF